MKKTITSVGLVMLGAATLHAQRTPYAPAPGLSSAELSKPWSVSASVRGFYDDNYTTAPSKDLLGNKNPDKRDAFGLEIDPSFALNWTLPQTYLGLNYMYGYRWYDNRPGKDYDQTHQANFKLSHAFTERYKIEVSDTFVSAQEPELLDQVGGVITRPIRTEGDNIHNYGSLSFTADLSEHLSSVLAYSNGFYDYNQRGTSSYSALLDRVEHLISANARWQFAPTTVGILGYQYGINDYTSKDLLSPFSTIRGTDRDSSSHYVFVGADHAFTSQLHGSARVGAQFTQYDSFNMDTVSPYADASISYQYNPGSSVSLGIRHSRNATDIAYLSPTSPTLDQETTTVYSTLNHRLTSKLMAGVIGQVQYAKFSQGSVDGEAETYLLAGANLTYDINRFLVAELGYNFDRLDSDLAFRSYTRNRVYIGLRASY
jgi:hypothetical protein